MHKHHAGNRNHSHLREEDETAEKLCRTDLKISVAWEFVVKKIKIYFIAKIILKDTALGF